MSASALRPRRFVAAFLRHSPEKAREMKTRGMGAMPPVAAYAALARAAARALELKHVFVSTANQAALESFTAMVRPDGLRVSFSANNRSEHDTEGGRHAEWAMLHGVIAAVNLHIVSQAAAYVSLRASTWTGLQRGMIASATLDAANLASTAAADVNPLEPRPLARRRPVRPGYEAWFPQSAIRSTVPQSQSRARAL